MLTGETGDAQAFVESLGTLARHPEPAVRGLFTSDAPVSVARAPGRLDVMGGIADYSGSLVLERPIAEATFAALQPSGARTLRVVSWNRTAPVRRADIELSTLVGENGPLSYDDARSFFRRDSWVAYVAGVFLVLMRERGVRFERGSNLLIFSAVPEGKGVASSAALEVSVMQAVSAAFDVDVDPQDVALLCQKAENLVAGAPCGVMDQMTCACGKADSLLALVCQPAELQPPVEIPEDLAFWGLDSGERHAVTGSDYESVRIGAFMGHRMLGLTEKDYLANIPPSRFERECVERLPDSLSGERFLSLYSGTTDTVTQVDPARTYQVRQPTAHPIYENHRVRTFRELMRSAPAREQRVQLGELMYESHASYSACGLGSPGTDMLVQLVRAEGPGSGLYGARITGGGSGGTVAVLGREDASSAIERVVRRYEDATGYHPYVFSGSSTGAAGFGSIALNLRT